ncbi:MAG: NAD(P)H-hydrate dehydratase [Candidatus Wallbacteria bacterium]|nr:NAD(P)H-hydrate dehydratase [Candidatus Wallbacteria bacterium]
MKVVTPAQMATIDRQAIEGRKLPGLLLMEHAGLKVLEALKRELPDWQSQRYLVVAGTGNNAGDGFVVARNLARAGAVVGVELVRGDGNVHGDARTNLDSLAAYGIEVFHARPGHPLRSVLADTTLVFDAMLGTGARGELSGDYREAVENINQAKKRVVAIDVPTGLDAATGQVQGPAVRASFTVTMGLPKLGFFQQPAPEYLGRLYVAEIGFPPTLLADRELERELLFGCDLAGLYPARKEDSHKGDYGRVLVIGGSRGMVGAAVLAARSAVRAGAGLVKLVVPASQQPVAASMTPEVMTYAAQETTHGTFSRDAVGACRELSQWADVTLIGPGLGRGAQIDAFVRELVATADGPMVLDADALHALEPGRPLPVGDFLATPHAGELSRWLGVESTTVRARRAEIAVEAARTLGATLVLKGPYSQVAGPDGRLAISPTGNPGMASGGSGDVLAGILLALRGLPGMASFDAMRLAVYLHGLAGDLALESVGGPSVPPTDILGQIPRAFEILRHAAAPIAYDKVRLI